MATDAELVDLVYAALLGEADWSHFVGALAADVPGGRTTMFVHDVVNGSGRFSLTAGFDAGEVEAYNATYAAINPWMKGASQRPLGLGVVADEMLAASDLRRTAFHDGFLRPMQVRSAVGVTVERSEGRLFLLSVLSERGGIDANRPHARRLTELAPHLRRAMRFRRHRPALDATGQAVLDEIGVGAVILGEGRRVGFVSAVAQGLIGRGRGFRIDATGRFQTADTDLNDRLSTLLAWPDPGMSEVLATVTRDGHATRLIARRIVTDGLSLYLQGPSVLLLLMPLTGHHDAVWPDLGRLEPLARLYGLTGAETEVLQALGGGLTPAQISALRGVTLETVRSQIKSLRHKTGATRQADLILLAARAGTLGHPHSGG